MRILFTCLSRSWGGLESFTLQTTRLLYKNNFSVELLCYPGSRLHNEAKKLGLVTHTARTRWNFHPLQIMKLSILLKQKNYDLIHTQLSKDLWTVVPALKLGCCNAPLFLSKQVGSFVNKKDFLHKRLYNRVTYAIAISEVIKENLINTTTLKQDKVILLHNGIDTERFDPAKYSSEEIRNEFNIKKNQILIGMMARFTPGKGHKEFLTAAKTLTNKYDNLRFMIIGEASFGEDKYAAHIKNLASEYNLSDKFIFTGYREDTPNVLAALDIFAFPSHSEAFGLALVEAMAMEKPSVCTHSDGVLDISIDGITAFHFRNNDVIDFICKLEQLIKSPGLRTKLGKAARKRVKEKFDSVIFTNKLIETYFEATNNSIYSSKLINN